MNSFKFKLLYQDKTTSARLGEIHTPHGIIATPAFVPVGTQATVKSLTPDELISLGIQIYFVNTYHMAMRPGIEIIKKLGGLHHFMHWDKPLLTDSGGFQVFSLARNKFPSKKTALSGFKAEEPALVTISEQGVTFRSHWDGALHEFTAESSMEHQWKLGADMHMAFDDCAPFPITHEAARASMERTHRWALQSLAAHIKHKRKRKYDQALYGVIQGSIYQDLRTQSADFISQQAFDGIAIGGVSVGESKVAMQQVCDWVLPRLPKTSPRHLLGVGEIDDIFEIIKRGVDTFDCVAPTRLARMGHIYQYPNSHLDINKKINAQDNLPLDPHCHCYSCTHFSRAYIHHLFRVHELLAYRLATIHNLHFVLSLVQSIRIHIGNGTFVKFQKDFWNH